MWPSPARGNAPRQESGQPQKDQVTSSDKELSEENKQQAKDQTRAKVAADIQAVLAELSSKTITEVTITIKVVNETQRPES